MVLPNVGKYGRTAALSVLATLVPYFASPQTPSPVAAQWTACGWGGGGFYYCAAFDPSNDGVIYMGGDVAGVYKSADHGKSWRMVNDGIASYGIFSLTVDRLKPKTVYAATEMGLCRSDDGAQHWRLLPKTGPSELRITGEKTRSIRNLAVDPTNSEIVYAGSPAGKVFKSSDGGQTWAAIYEPGTDSGGGNLLQAQFGKVNGDWYGGLWLPLELPKSDKVPTGFGFTFRGDGTVPREAYLTLKTDDGVPYRSRNLNEIFKDKGVHEVTLSASEFTVEADYLSAHPAIGALDWKKVRRMDFACVGPLAEQPTAIRIGDPFFSVAGPGIKDARLPAAKLNANTVVQTYGNIKAGAPVSGPVYSVVVSEKRPSVVLAATDQGLAISRDAGKSWRIAEAPRKASSAAVSASNPKVIYGSFFGEGVWKSTDQGQSWMRASEGMVKGVSILEVAVSPTNADEVYAVGSAGWNGHFYRSTDGAKTWTESSTLTPDRVGDPTLPKDGSAGNLSAPTNIAINPKNPQELFVSANWRPVHSGDAGKTWNERVTGADISVITDIRFRDRKAYVTVMDEGALVSEDRGASWRQMWPLSYDPKLGGHFWRIGFSGNRIITTSSPWERTLSQVVTSDDDGKSFQVVTTGLPAYATKANVMWDRGYPRALAVDPKNPKVVYLGLDGDPADGNAGGGIFRSTDAGLSWKPLPAQPASRRMFYGLAVDPTNSDRLYWGTCGPGGGLYRSEDGGASWKLIFTNESWLFNVHVAEDGTLYAPGKNLWRSGDHGATWQQMTHFTGDQTLIGFEMDPRDPKSFWMSATTWGPDTRGGIFRTRDGGATWQDITGDIGIRKPLVLRFDPATNELWAGGPALFRIKQ